MLYCLTFADMKATSPKVWNDWKSTLLREVYEVTRTVLSSRRGLSTDLAHVEARKKRVEGEIHEELAKEQKVIPEHVVSSFVEVMTDRYMLGVPPRHMVRHIEMWREVKERGGIALHVKQQRREGSTRLTIVCPDRPGLLSLLAGTIAANRMQILSAQIFSIEDLAVDVLYVKDESGELVDDPKRVETIRSDLHAVIVGGKDVKKLLDQKLFGSTLKERPKPAVKTEIAVVNDVSKTETVLDVFCQDRLGALYTIAQALADAGLTIRVAKISTQGDRVADGFYVIDAATGQKVVEKERIEAIKRSVREAIDRR
jgi:[protein-PII] uridylyltransferase